MPQSQLLQQASVLSRVPFEKVHELAATVTAGDPDPVVRGLTGLNYDGTPVQFCMSIASSGIRHRLLGDPACDESEPAIRYRRSTKALERAIVASASQELRPLIQQTLDYIVGDAFEMDCTSYADGVLWLGVPLAGRGIAMYVDARRGDAVAPERLDTWLSLLGPATDDRRALVNAVRAGRIMSLGLEGISPTAARAKVYWRLGEDGPLSRFGIPLFTDKNVAAFVHCVLGEREVPLDGIVLSAGLDVKTLRFADAKVDICTCPRCCPLDGAGSRALVARLLELLELPAIDFGALFDACELAFVGIGVDTGSNVRLNLYVKPRR